MVRKDSQGRRLCTAHTAKGVPCSGPALIGATVCRMHGGSAPQVKEVAARVKLEELIGPSLARLKQLVEDDDTLQQVHLGAVKLVLEMTGFKAPTQVEVIPPLSVINDWVEQLEAEEL